jgi:hypothetical protein
MGKPFVCAWKTEWMKLRHRKIGFLLLVFFAVEMLWILWEVSDAHAEMIRDGYRMVFIQFELLNSLLMPTMISMLASRLCDAEVKGNNLKLLCTMEPKGRLFHMKLLVGSVYLAIFTAGQIALIMGMGKYYGFTRPLEPVHLFFFVVETYVVGLAILLLQVVLSFFFENQILPLATGIFGSFIGLFSWFLHGTFAENMKKMILWAYYSLLCVINYNWDEETRITTYYSVPFPIGTFCLLLSMLVVGYAVGKLLFLKKEI